jgi:hypothetical protein
VYYRIRRAVLNPNYSKILINKVEPLTWENDLPFLDSYLGNDAFRFLNITHQFNEDIDWNFNNYGKLWTYNLNYFDFLNQKGIVKDEGMKLIENYLKNEKKLIDGKAPYPISLRGKNWIKFLSKHKITDQNIKQNLYNHYQI